MLKLMENDYVFNWNMLQEANASDLQGDIAFYHKGACDNILRYYAMFLDCTIAEARERMQKRIRGETC